MRSSTWRTHIWWWMKASIQPAAAYGFQFTFNRSRLRPFLVPQVAQSCLCLAASIDHITIFGLKHRSPILQRRVKRSTEKMWSVEGNTSIVKNKFHFNNVQNLTVHLDVTRWILWVQDNLLGFKLAALTQKFFFSSKLLLLPSQQCCSFGSFVTATSPVSCTNAHLSTFTKCMQTKWVIMWSVACILHINQMRMYCINNLELIPGSTPKH